MFTGIFLAAAMLLTFVAAWTGSRPAAAALVCEAVVWLEVSSVFEGPTIVRFNDDHGFVTADLVTVAAIFLAFLAWRKT